MNETLPSAIAFLLLLLTVPAVLIVLARLLKGARRHAAIAPQPATPEMLGVVSIVVPTLNEAQRIAPCLRGLQQQSYEVREILIVDSNSTDGTRERVRVTARRDRRFRLLTDDPLPADWVGRPWALNYGFLQSSAKSRWILGIDADTKPQAGLVAGLLALAEVERYDLISLSPQFILEYPGEWWLQPALLMTLLYRFEASGVNAPADRVMANGQCFFCRRSVLEVVNGYTCAKASFCDDVTLARQIAARGYKVGFFDGRRVLQVRMYEGFAETWREWGRSLDLKDASTPTQLSHDLWLLLCVQALPLPLALLSGALLASGYDSLPIELLAALNCGLVAIRFALLIAIVPSYRPPASWLFWLSPLADSLAVLRIFLSATRQPKQWRGRTYSSLNRDG